MVSGWVGVDLDGTLAEYDGWNEGKIGSPVPDMLDRVKGWIKKGVEVRILTARVSAGQREEQLPLIEQWCEEHVGTILPVTCEKDFSMIELWDDRCVQVIPNTGERVSEKAKEAFWRCSDWIHKATDTMWINHERGDFEFREFLREAEKTIGRPGT